MCIYTQSSANLVVDVFGYSAERPRVDEPSAAERTTFEHWLDVVTRSMPPSALPMQMFVDPGVPFVTTLSRGFDLCSPVGG